MTGCSSLTLLGTLVSHVCTATPASCPHVHLLVEVLVDFLLVGESQHAADHASVFGGPPQVADLRPAVFVLDLHHTLRDGKPLFGNGHHGPESHLLDLVVIDLSLLANKERNSFHLEFQNDDD